MIEIIKEKNNEWKIKNELSQWWNTELKKINEWNNV